MANRPEFATPDNWATYFHTADINATVSAVTAEAGTPVWHQLTTRDYRAAGDLPRDLRVADRADALSVDLATG
jgi:predicted enzyme related to lactoylglutathione lyase